MKKIILSILFSMLSTIAYANSGKINLEGFASTLNKFKGEYTY